MNKKSNIGHLITIKETSTGKREFLFLYITGDKPSDVYKKVIKGIRTLDLPERLIKNTAIQADAVTDFTRIINEYPETEGKTIHKLPVTAFYDTNKDAFKENLFLSGVINVVEKNGSLFPLNRLGAIVTGSDFFNREEKKEELWENIKKGQNVLLCGPRRYGKTSIMKELYEKASYHGFSPVMIDLESIFSIKQFISRMWIEIEYPDLFDIKKNKKQIKIEEDIPELWIKKGDKIFNRISKRSEKFLFLLDECPYMLDSFLTNEGRDRTKNFLKWFKDQRIRCKNNCIFLLTGSVHLDSYLKDQGFDENVFDDCIEIRLNFLNPDEVHTYIESILLGQGIFLNDEIIQEIVKINKPGIPYFIQIVLNHVVNLYRKNPKFKSEDLRKTYWENIIGSEGRRYFDSFFLHFKRYGKRETGAKAVLKELSNAGDSGQEILNLEKIYNISSIGIEEPDFNIVLNYLEYDFYIEKIVKTNRYRFASSILRDYWQKNQN